MWLTHRGYLQEKITTTLYTVDSSAVFIEPSIVEQLKSGKSEVSLRWTYTLVLNLCMAGASYILASTVECLTASKTRVSPSPLVFWMTSSSLSFAMLSSTCTGDMSFFNEIPSQLEAGYRKHCTKICKDGNYPWRSLCLHAFGWAIFIIDSQRDHHWLSVNKLMLKCPCSTNIDEQPLFLPQRRRHPSLAGQ